MTRFNVGGTSQWLFNLSQGLSENEIENLLLVGECPKSETEDSRLSKIPHKKIVGLGPKNSLASTISSFFQLRRAIKDFRPDIVNTHTSKAGVLGRIAAFSLPNRPTIVHTYQVIRHALRPYSAIKGLINGRINGQHSAGGNLVNLQGVEQAGREPAVF